MIIKGKSRNNAAQAGRYLLELGENERVELIETRGTLAQDVKGACAEMEALAAGTNCDKFLYHASLSPAKGERFTREEKLKQIDELEKNLGLEGHQRIVVEHEKNGCAHDHVLWSRINPETLKAVRMSWNYVQHERTAREIEKQFGLEKVQGVHVDENGQLLEKGDERRADYAPTRRETENAKKSGVNLKQWRKELREIAAEAEGKSGAELIEALERDGHMVAKGDSVAFVILDPSGKAHRMAQSLKIGVDDLKERLADVDPASLANEKEARERQKAQQAQLEKEKAFTLYDRGGMASQQADAMQHLKEKERSRRLREARENTEKERQEKTAQEMRSAGAEVGAKKEKSPAELQQETARKREQEERQKAQEPASAGNDKGRAVGKGKTQGEAARDHRRATTEQTDRKQRLSVEDAMKELFESNRKKTGGHDLRGDWRDMDRERERER